MNNTLQVGVEVDETELKEAVATIESAFPDVKFENCHIKKVYVNYTQNNFKEESEDK